MHLVISTMKNEGLYLLEWLAYHKSIGFDRFLIYTNDCSDGTDHMLDRLQELGHVDHRRNVVLRRGPHKSALKYARESELFETADWIYVTDADEFLNIRTGNRRVGDLIAAYPDADVIPVTWRMFSNDSQTALPVGLTTETFQDAEPENPTRGDSARFVKSLFRPDPGITRIGLHAPVYDEAREESVVWGSPARAAGADHNPRWPRKHFGYGVAQVNHYAVRSVDAYLLKRDRGRANHFNDTLGAKYWNRWNLGGVRETSIAPLLPAVKAHIAEYLEDPQLAFLHRAARALAKERLVEMLEDPEIRALRRELEGQDKRQKRPYKSPAPEPAVASGPADANSELEAKAPKRHKRRQEMLGHMPKGAVCAEIGVWNGGFSVEILNITRPKELVLIDPWDLLAQQSKEEWNHKRHEDAAFMGGMYDNVVRAYGDRNDVTIRKGFSADILETYSNDYFDWVYIDGNHQYDFVKSDVEIAFRKVRPGGIIAGDDFFWKKNGRMHVREAVLDVLAAFGLERKKSLSRIGQQFMIQVPE